MRLQLIERLAALLTAAFGLVAALAWNGAIAGLFARVFSNPDDLTGKFLHALVVTLIVVAATIWVSNAADRAKRRALRTNADEDRPSGPPGWTR